MPGRSSEGSPLMQAALAYAERGIPVFPLQPRGKLPLIPKDQGGRGFEDATTDRDIIRQWWSRFPQANIGIATGRRAGFWVLDIDAPGVTPSGKEKQDGAASLTELERINGRLPPTVAQRTPTGGHHRFFRINGVEIRNRASKAGPGIDTRGEGGYVVAPPSVHPNGHPYEWMDGAGLDTELADAPAWLVDLLTKKPEPTPSPNREPTDRSNAYVEAAFARELAALSGAHQGARNDQLNLSAFALGQFVGAGLLGRSRCEIALRSAAAGLGLDERETIGTIKSGLDAGALQPREIPEQSKAKPKAAPAYDSETGEVNEPTSPIPLQWFADITPETEAQDFVEGLLTSTSLSVIYGEPGCGKTFFLLDLCLHVALGNPWFGRDVSGGVVVYVCLEGWYGLRNRITAFRNQYGLSGTNVPFAVVTSPISMLDPAADVPRLIETVKACGEIIGAPVRLVAIDTLSRALAGGDENSPEDMGALVMNASKIIAASKAHVCFVHHSGKDKSRGARGHNLLRGAVDTEIEIVRDEGSRVSTAKVRKQKDLDVGEAFSFGLKVIDLGPNSRGKPLTSCVVELADNPENVDDPVAKMNDAERAALQEIQELIARAGQPVVPERGMASVIGVNREQVREWFVKRGLLGIDNKGNIDGVSRVKFTRALARLKEQGKIAVHGEWVWHL